LTYDPKVLTVSASDITLGSIPGLGSGWHLVSVIDPVTGQIGIDLFSTTAITATQAGSLVNIAFHIMPGAYVPATAVQLVNGVTPNGHWFSTEVADGEGKFVLSPGMDRLMIQTGLGSVSLAAPVSMDHAATAALNHGQVSFEGLRGVVEEPSVSSLLGTEANEVLAILSNGTVAGEEAPHTVPANLIVTGALAFQTNAATLAATQLVGQVFQLSNVPALSAALGSTTPQQLMDRLFLALARWTDAPADQAQETFWTNAVRGEDWLAIPTSAVESGTDSSAVTEDQQAADQQAVSDRIAVVDQVFAQLVDETDDFSDFGDN